MARGGTDGAFLISTNARNWVQKQSDSSGKGLAHKGEGLQAKDILKSYKFYAQDDMQSRKLKGVTLVCAFV